MPAVVEETAVAEAQEPAWDDSLLSDEERQIVVLYAMTGLKHREIADLLDLKLTTVLSKYSRAIKKLRSALKEADR